LSLRKVSDRNSKISIYDIPEENYDIVLKNTLIKYGSELFSRYLQFLMVCMMHTVSTRKQFPTGGGGDASGVERKEYDYLIHLKGCRNLVACSIFYFFQIQLSWYYFAIRHGKGVVEGIGGSVKYLVYRPILSGKECTSTADFFRIAPSKTNTIELNEVEQYPIDNSKQQFEKSSC
jgi:hypothetical protein